MLRRPGPALSCLTTWARYASTSSVAVPRARGRPRKISLVEPLHDESTTNSASVKTKSTRAKAVEKALPLKAKKPGKNDLPKPSTRPRKRGTKCEDTTIQPEEVGAVCDVGTSSGLASSNKSLDLEDPPRVALGRWRATHHDLASFLAEAAQRGLKTTTAVYKGTHYEYTVAETLKSLNFALRRSGRANDYGIDLIGKWLLPQEPRELKVLISCKLSKPSPSMVRELEGAYVGAPAGWRGSDVMGMLITSRPPTEGVRQSLQRSRLPLCFVQISAEGAILQFIWNNVATEERLMGMSVTLNHPPSAAGKGEKKSEEPMVQDAVSLMWMGKPWKGKHACIDSDFSKVCAHLSISSDQSHATQMNESL